MTCIQVCFVAVSKIQQVWKMRDVEEKLESAGRSISSPAEVDALTAGITFAFIASFDVDSSSCPFVVRRWSVVALCTWVF